MHIFVPPKLLTTACINTVASPLLILETFFSFFFFGWGITVNCLDHISCIFNRFEILVLRESLFGKTVKCPLLSLISVYVSWDVILGTMN